MSRCRWLLVFLPIALVGVSAAARVETAEEKNEKILKRFVEELVPLTPGTGKFPASFKMGSDGDAPAREKPIVTVTFKAPFALARYEVTQELYERVMGRNPSKWKGPRNSVEMVSWEEANDFCRKLTDELRRRKLIADEESIRLPSEAEWEYACRAGTTTRWSFGDDPKDLGEYAWFKGNAAGNDPPVGKKKPNAWGFHDMHGYVWEWCADAWNPTHEGAATDGRPREAKEAKERVIRGGAWTDGPEQARCAYREHKPLDFRSDAIGFRCVKAKK